MNATQQIRVGVEAWLAEIERENENHPRRIEILAYCEMAFTESDVSVERANEVAKNALRIFPA